MKLSVSLTEEDVEFLDEYAQTQGYRSRSAVVQKAVRLLHASELGRDYADAWKEWSESGDDGVWQSTVADGLVSD